MPAGYLALLRGINVGGNNKIRMADLAAIFIEAGCKDVVTYIQSGNVLFNANPTLVQKIPELITTAMQQRLSLRIPVILRTRAQLQTAIAANPYPEAAATPKLLHLLFLADTPTASSISSLDPNRSAPDRYTILGRDIYLCLATGVAGTKLTNAYFDSRLKTLSTGRNWLTATKLLELMQAGCKIEGSCKPPS